MSHPARAPPRPTRSLLDDAQAFATAILYIALGLSLLAEARLLTGGVPGLAFLLGYATGLPLGAALFLVNLPAVDAAIVAAAFAVVEPQRVAYSVVGSLFVNLVLVWNHRPAPDAALEASTGRN